MRKLTLWLIAFLLSASIAFAQPGGPGALVSEVDGTPNAFVTRIIFPNGTLTIANGAATYTGAAAAETDPVAGAISGIVMGDGAGNLSAAVSGTHYLTPAAIALLYMDINYLDGSSDAAQSIALYDGTANKMTLTLSGALGGDVSVNLDTSAGIAAMVTDETGSGALVFGTSPNFTTSVTFNAVTDTIAGIQNQNLLDKTANEILSGDWQITGNAEVQDNIHLSFGNDDDDSFVHTTADAAQTVANALCLVDSSDNIAFVFDLSNGIFHSKASTTPEMALYDSDSGSGDTNWIDIRNDQWAGSWGANQSTTTENSEVTDLIAYAMPNSAVGTKTEVLRFDGSEEYWNAHSYPVKAYDEVQMIVFDFTTNISTGDGAFYFHIGQKLDGMNLTYCHAEVITAATGTGVETIDIEIYNVTDSQDMLSTTLTVDEDETGSDTATAYAINATYDDVAENDVIRVDIDTVPSTTPGTGLIVTLGFNMP